MSSAGILPTSRPRSLGRAGGRASARRRARFGDDPQVGPGGDAGPRQFGGGTAQGPGTAHDDIEAVAQSTDPFDPLMALTEPAQSCSPKLPTLGEPPTGVHLMSVGSLDARGL